METLQAWQAFRVVDQTAPFLSPRFVTARFEFRGRDLAGQQEERQRWRRGVQLVDSSLGEIVGKAYVERYFPPQSKARMEELVADIKGALRGRIERLTWMTPQTKTKALEKLDLFGVKIGYPDKWRDYTALRIDPDDLVGNVRRATAFRWAYAVAKLDKPVDPQEWGTTPQVVNAYYMSTRNEIVFPAGILQPPFFDPNADMAINYGGIGGVIGHELTHGFDDQGRKSDGHGVLTDWWQPADADKFNAEAAKYGAQYDAYSVAPGVNVKGAQTMGENIADLGGILLALDAYRASLHGAAGPGARRHHRRSARVSGLGAGMAGEVAPRCAQAAGGDRQPFTGAVPGRRTVAQCRCLVRRLRDQAGRQALSQAGGPGAYLVNSHPVMR